MSAEDYKRRLERVAKAAAHAGYNAVLSEAQRIATAMKTAVPRDKGTLADSIRLETDSHRGRVHIKAGGATTTRPARGRPYDYARAQEFGSSDQPANPFFFPMWRLMRKSARARIAKAMKQAIESEMQR